MKEKKRIVTTPRLVLKDITYDDKKRLLLLANNLLIKKTYMIPDFLTKESEDQFFEKIRNLTLSSKHYSYGIYLKNKLIGFINDVSIEDDLIEIGYFINPKQWNKGYATEALSAMIKELFEAGFDTVIAGHFKENPASGRVMIKCGMSLIDKTETIEYRDQKHECVYYQINK